MKLSSSTLRRAAEIQERIEQLEKELTGILETADGNVAAENNHFDGEETAPSESTPNPTQRHGRKVATQSTPAPEPRTRGRRSTSPTGPLAPAVVKVLKSKNSPMSVSEILDGLLSNGYKFTSPEPKKNLFARIYRLKGVKQVGPGKFSVE